MLKKQEAQAAKKKKQQLLVEPAIEEEQQVSNWSDECSGNDSYNVICKSSSNQQQKNRKKRELSSLIMILFGSMLLLACSSLAAQEPEQAKPSLANAQTPLPKLVGENFTVVTEATIKEEVPLLLATNFTRIELSLDERPESNATTPLATVKKASSAAGEEREESAIVTTFPPELTDDEGGDGDGDGDGDDESVNPEGEKAAADANGANKLNNVLLDTLGSAADKLIERSRPIAVDEEGDSNLDEETGGLVENHELPSIEVPLSNRRKDHEVAKKRQVDVRSPQTEPEVASLAGAEASARAKNDTLSSKAAEQSKKQLRVAFETYSRWRAAADDLVELFSRKMLPLIMEHGYDVDTVTVSGLLQVFNGIRAIKPWALKLLDASAKITPGLLVGTQSDFGDFDECLNVRVDDPSGLVAAGGIPDEIDPTTGLRQSTLIGRYCLADIEFPKPPRQFRANDSRESSSSSDRYAPIELRKPLLNFSETAQFKETVFVETGNFFHMLYVDPIRIGLCLTNKIDPDSFAQVFNKIFQEFQVSIKFNGRCATKYDRPIWSTYQTVSANILLTVCSLVIICTLLDLLHTKLNKLPLPLSLSKWKVNLQYSMFKYRPLFTSFSLIRNTKRLFKPQVARGEVTKEEEEFNQALKYNQFYNNLSLNNQQLNISSHNKKLAAINHTNSFATNANQSSSSSPESSPSIERRSSETGSALNLISEQISRLESATAAATTPAFSSFSTPGATIHNQLVIGNGASERRRTIKEVEASLRCLNGIRVITMIWMIINHTYMFGGFFVLWAYRRLIDIAEWPKSISFQLVLNGWLTVETYFFLSAAIIVLGTMPLMRTSKFSYLSYIVHRLVRLLPAYVGLVCLNFLWPLISSGPVWLVKGKSFIQTPCENYLWTNFLFINNWIWPEKQCMVHTWFLSADFQLYLLAPIIVYLLHRRPVVGHSLNIIVAIVASIFSGFVIYANKLLPTTLINKLEFDSIKQQLSYSYFATYQHMGPYCLGILIGYLLHKRPQIRLPKHLTWLLWLLLPPLSFTTLLLTYLWNGAYDDPNLINPSPLVSAFYVAIHRTIWSSLLAWIVFACATGRAKIMSSFLSHPIFVPLSRLSFCIYLVHLPVIMFKALNLRHTTEWTDSNILWEACGNFVASLIVGYFVYVAFESPFVNLEHIIMGRGDGSGETTKFMAKHRLIYNGNLSSSLTSSQPLQPGPQIEGSRATACSSSGGESCSIESDDKRSAVDLCSAAKMDARFPNLGEHGDGLPQSEVEDHQKQQQFKKKSLRPKQNLSVEKIFGQMEPASPSEIYDTNRAAGKLLHQQTVGQQREQTGRLISSLSTGELKRPPIRRYSIMSAAETGGLNRDNSQVDTIYPISTSEYQYFSIASEFGGNQLVGRANGPNLLNGGQPQYATLARTSRIHRGAACHQLNKLTDHYQSDCFNRRGAVSVYGVNSNSKSKSHLSEPISFGAGPPLIQEHLFVPNPHHQHHQGQPASFTGQRNQMFARRQGRYNTLTGTGTRGWRKNEYFSANQRLMQVDDEQTRSPVSCDEDNWTQLDSCDSIAAVAGGGQAVATGWLQPGALIPRIDSSTLRRHSNAIRPEPAGSIVEEEREDSVSDDGQGGGRAGERM